MEICYSTNEEDYNHDELEEAVESAFEDAEVGDVRTVFEADTVPHKASEFIPNICEYMQDRAYDECGEWAEVWDFNADHEKELQEEIAKVVDAWADRHECQPNFYGIGSSKPIKVRLKDEDGAFEIVSENKNVE